MIDSKRQLFVAIGEIKQFRVNQLMRSLKDIKKVIPEKREIYKQRLWTRIDETKKTCNKIIHELNGKIRHIKIQPYKQRKEE